MSVEYRVETVAATNKHTVTCHGDHAVGFEVGILLNLRERLDLMPQRTAIFLTEHDRQAMRRAVDLTLQGLAGSRKDDDVRPQLEEIARVLMAMLSPFTAGSAGVDVPAATASGLASRIAGDIQKLWRQRRDLLDAHRETYVALTGTPHHELRAFDVSTVDLVPVAKAVRARSVEAFEQWLDSAATLFTSEAIAATRNMLARYREEMEREEAKASGQLSKEAKP